MDKEGCLPLYIFLPMGFPCLSNPLSFALTKPVLSFLDSVDVTNPFRDKLALFLSLVCRPLGMKYHSPSKSRAIEIYHLKLMVYLGNNYKTFVNYLLERNIVGCDEVWVKGCKEKKIKSKCKCYWLCEEYLGETAMFEAKSLPIRKAVARAREQYSNTEALDSYLDKVAESMSHFSVDEGKAETLLSEAVAKGEMSINDFELEMGKARAVNGKESDIEPYCKKDKYGRVHTVHTSMSKKVRKSCMSCDGEKVRSIDITATYPALLAKLLKLYGESYDVCLEGKTWCKPIIPIRSNVYHAVNYLTWDKAKIDKGWSGGLPTARKAYGAELDRYVAIMKKGGIYDWFGKTTGLGKKKCKALLIRYICGESPSNWGWKKIYCAGDEFHTEEEKRDMLMFDQAWVREFPLLRKAIDAMKRKSYKTLSHTLESMEAAIMHGHVTKRIMKELKTPFLTVYDCVIVKEQHAESVERILNEELDRHGVPTSCHVET